jgi:hypothetical protein
VRGVSVASLAGATAAGALVAVADGEAASRVIDRTLVCRPAGTGHPDPIRFMTVWADRSRPHPGGAPLPPSAVVGNPGAGDLGVHASIRTGPHAGVPTGAVSLSRRPCRPTKIHVPLSTRGLAGGRTSPTGDNYKCDVPATVLIRLRANFERPTRFVRDARFSSTDVARGQISTGYLAVTTLRGRRPIVFASVNDTSGEARLFVAPSRCGRS